MSAMDRGHGTRGKGKGGPSRPPARRAPPPPGTGLENQFFEDAQRSGEPWVVVLTDGRTLAGIVRDFDRDQLTLALETGEVVIRKSEIRYLHEA